MIRHIFFISAGRRAAVLQYRATHLYEMMIIDDYIWAGQNTDVQRDSAVKLISRRMILMISLRWAISSAGAIIKKTICKNAQLFDIKLSPKTNFNSLTALPTIYEELVIWRYYFRNIEREESSSQCQPGNSKTLWHFLPRWYFSRWITISHSHVEF